MTKKTKFSGTATLLQGCNEIENVYNSKSKRNYSDGIVTVMGVEILGCVLRQQCLLASFQWWQHLSRLVHCGNSGNTPSTVATGDSTTTVITSGLHCASFKLWMATSISATTGVVNGNKCQHYNIDGTLLLSGRNWQHYNSNGNWQRYNSIVIWLHSSCFHQR